MINFGHNDEEYLNLLKDSERENLPQREIILPSSDYEIIKSAEQVFSIANNDKSLFRKGKFIFECNGANLDNVSDSGLRTRIEKMGDTKKWIVHKNDNVLANRRPSKEDCRAIIDSPAITLLPEITYVLQHPILIKDGNNSKLLKKGYNEEMGGVIILNDKDIIDVPFDEAVKAIEGLLIDYKFVALSDKARMIAAIITPALRLGGFLDYKCPAICFEANLPQTGKGMSSHIISYIYNEPLSNIGLKKGGVGSFDESLSAAMLRGSPFILIDNVREKIDSKLFENIMTANSNAKIGLRVPHLQEIPTDVSRFMFFITSNGMESTIDLAARCCIIRLVKNDSNKVFKNWEVGESLEEHTRLKSSYYRSCIYSVLKRWIEEGMPLANESRHDFRIWAKTVSYIVKMGWPQLPLVMDDHQEAQNRLSTPALSWLRKVCQTLKLTERESYTAGTILEICEENDIEFPKPYIRDDQKLPEIGKLLKSCFRESDTIEVDGVTIERKIKPTPREDGKGNNEQKVYSFSKSITPESDDMTPF